MVRKCLTLATVVMLALPPQLLMAAEPDGDPTCPSYYSDSIFRFGWWGTENDGSPVKVGEWQDLDSSPFWDADGIFSNGCTTLDYFANGTDNETSQAGLYWYNSAFTADIDFQRFIHRLDHKPLFGYSRDPASLGEAVATDDLDLGKDYAIRVQELDARFKGRITENLKWRLNLWGLRRSGERQVSSVQHCFTNPANNQTQCHVQSQGQQIDWLTSRIEPVIEGNFFDKKLNVEYSRPMRYSARADENVERLYNHFGFFQTPDPISGEGGAGFYDYALVPDNFTQIDRLKIQAVVTENTDFYASLVNGNTENKLRDTNRRFYGYDVRMNNRSMERLTVNVFAKWYTERQQAPRTFLGIDEQVEPINDLMSLSGIRFNDIHTPLDYTRTKAGFDFRWRPCLGNTACTKLRFNTGYEFTQLDRDNASYVISDISNSEPPLDPGQVYTLPNSTTHMMYVGANRKFSPAMEAYVRYKLRLTDDPLYGLRLADENFENGDLTTFSNTSLPEQEHIVEIGGTWMPTEDFGLNAYFALENRRTDNIFARFDEDNYPMVLSAWWSADAQWTFSASYAYYSNWIDQDITIGYRDSTSGNEAFTDPWRYTGRSQVVDFGVQYDWSECLILTGGVQHVRGRDAISNTYSVGDWSQLPNFTDVNVETWRVSGGIDYLFGQTYSCFFRYNYYDYDDMSFNSNSGLSHMLLGGISAVY